MKNERFGVLARNNEIILIHCCHPECDLALMGTHHPHCTVDWRSHEKAGYLVLWSGSTTYENASMIAEACRDEAFLSLLYDSFFARLTFAFAEIWLLAVLRTEGEGRNNVRL